MLRIENFSKSYGKINKAVDNLTLHVKPGDIYGFIGHNGAGKTTTIRAAVGVMDFDEGEIFIGGHSVKKDPLACKSITAYIPDNPDIYGYLSGIKYLNFISDIFGVSESGRREKITEYAAAFEMEQVLGDIVSSYSHGMRQKLAIIAALVHSPKMLILDEPFVGLDPKAAHTLKGIMRRLCEDGGAIFFSTHVLDVAEKLCTKIAIIKNGRLVASGDTESIRGDSSLEDVFLEILEEKS